MNVIVRLHSENIVQPMVVGVAAAALHLIKQTFYIHNTKVNWKLRINTLPTDSNKIKNAIPTEAVVMRPISITSNQQ